MAKRRFVRPYILTLTRDDPLLWFVFNWWLVCIHFRRETKDWYISRSDHEPYNDTYDRVFGFIRFTYHGTPQQWQRIIEKRMRRKLWPFGDLCIGNIDGGWWFGWDVSQAMPKSTKCARVDGDYYYIVLRNNKWHNAIVGLFELMTI